MAGKIAPEAVRKTALRKEVIAARDALPTNKRAAFSAHITAKLLTLDEYRNARCVLAYMSFGSEFDTSALIEHALTNRKALCLPRVNREARALELHLVTNPDSDLHAGMWGIREPRAECPIADMTRVDFVLLPGVAFTARCERLGYGGGFYDRLITRFTRRPPLIAAAFAMQICAAIPLDAHDVPIDAVVTEESVYCCS